MGEEVADVEQAIARILAAQLVLVFGTELPCPRSSRRSPQFSSDAAAERIPNLDTLKKELREYHDCTCTCGCYAHDLDVQADRAIAFLRQRAAHRQPHEKLALILDIDETTLSNYQEMLGADFAYNKPSSMQWVDTAQAPAIPGTLRLYKEAQRLGVSIFFITGRDEAQRAATERNLRAQGFDNWKQLVMRPADHGSQTIGAFKAVARGQIARAGLHAGAECGRPVERPEGQAGSGVLSEVSRPVLLHSVACGLMDANVAGAGFDAHRGPAAADGALHMVVVHRALRHDLAVAMNAAGAGLGVERQPRIACPKLYASRAGVDAPGSSGRAVNLDIARAGSGLQPAAQILQLDRTRAGARFHVAGADLLGVDVTRAGADGESAFESGGVDRSRACAQFCICAHAFVGHVARSRRSIQIGVGRSQNLIVDADVAEIVVIPSDADDVACLLDGRMRRDLAAPCSSLAPQPDLTRAKMCTRPSGPLVRWMEPEPVATVRSSRPFTARSRSNVASLANAGTAAMAANVTKTENAAQKCLIAFLILPPESLYAGGGAPVP